MELTTKEIGQLKNNLNEYLEKFYLENSINIEQPIDIFDVLKKIGFSIYYAKLESYDGLIVVNEEIDYFRGFKSNKIIAANSELSYEHSVFVLAHELAHYLCAKWLSKNEEKIQVEYREPHKSDGRSESENFIDKVAAAILLPEKPFIKMLNGFGITKSNQKTEEIIKKLAIIYDLEEILISRRIDEVLV